MKKTYISPSMLAVKLNTRQCILTVSGGMSGTLNIDDENTITSSSSVWTKESNSVWDEEW